jgi:hypothetical protein
MLCSDCGEKPAQEGRSTCFRCRVSGVGFSFRGGAVIGRKGWNTTKTEWLSEHIGTDSEKQLAKRTDVERV